MQPLRFCLYFNPLPRKEGDAICKHIKHIFGNFNPLPRKEGDPKRLAYVATIAKISIHSLVKRETLFLTVGGVAYGYFNPLPRKEGDQTSRNP